MRKLFDLTLKTFLFLSPIFFFRNYQLSMARGMFFVIGSFTLFGISLGLEPKRKLSNVWVSAFFMLALLRAFIGNGIEPSEWFNFWLSFASFIYVLAGILLFYVVYTYADNIKQYFKPIVVVCILNCILLTAQLFNYDFMWANTGFRGSLCGFMEMPAQLGQYSAMSIPILFFINPLLSLIPLFTLLVSKSVSPAIACAVGVLVLCWYKKREFIPLALLIICALVIVGSGHIQTKFRPRMGLWKQTLSKALEKPYIGGGYRSYHKEVIGGDEIKKSGDKEIQRPQSDYLHTMQEIGIPIVIIMFFYFSGLFKKFKAIKVKDKLLCCLVASVLIVLVNMAGQSCVRYASVASTFIVLLAFLNIKLEDKQWKKLI